MALLIMSYSLIFSRLGFRFRRPDQYNYVPTFPVLGCLPSFYKNRHRLLDWYTELVSASPSHTVLLDRLGAGRTIVTGNPMNVEYVLKTRFENFPKGRPFTELLGDLLGRGIFNADGDLWHAQRKLASHEFSAKSLREFLVGTLRTQVEARLLPELEAACASETAVDVQEILRRFAFDVVCHVSLGTEYPEGSEFARAFDVASAISAGRGRAPVFAVWKAKRALRVGSEKKLKEAIDVIHGSVTELIRSRKKEECITRKKDLLSKLISMSDMDEELIRDMIISFVMAGRDTTSSAMTWLFWLLSCNKDVENELVQEIESKIGSSSSSSSSIKYENVKEMSLLKACLCESMRLYPPVAWDSKHAAAADVLPDGTRVRKGDRVTYFPYGMGRLESLWGMDCGEFKPRRWIVDDGVGGGVLVVSPYKYPVFQGGPRVCLGKEMAFIQMKYVVASILRRFELVPANPGRVPRFVPLLTAHMAGGLNVYVRRRK
ncbi:hypothetical protein H6P81_012283 [Aristolochia fimbriata]|uniref:Cytochrome P450 n=1 Tax=Aristolochia fimbriata TaxID=158543 RepID=A0AAV7EDG5_ARIFI|nr:hypothetical protein H6P81_012283 [Aristolochia fimbriata]